MRSNMKRKEEKIVSWKMWKRWKKALMKESYLSFEGH